MLLHITAELVNGESLTVTTTAAHVIAWERRTGRSYQQFLNDVHLEDLAFLAWEATRTSYVGTGSAIAPFDTWLQELKSIKFGAEQPRPTDAAPSDA